eukprot:XP_016657809.1 PREDICTED: uncharacterized protein LOC100574938 [Acyrthosiphon pisum]
MKSIMNSCIKNHYLPLTLSKWQDLQKLKKFLPPDTHSFYDTLEHSSSFKPRIVLVVGVARTGQLLEDAVNPTLEAIDGWMSSRGLELAHHKSEAVLLTKRRAFVPPRLVVGGHHIELAKKLRYLGIILDQRLTFAPHVETVAERASRSAVSLARLMPNVRGLCQ